MCVSICDGRNFKKMPFGQIPATFLALFSVKAISPLGWDCISEGDPILRVTSGRYPGKLPYIPKIVPRRFPSRGQSANLIDDRIRGDNHPPTRFPRPNSRPQFTRYIVQYPRNSVSSLVPFNPRPCVDAMSPGTGRSKRTLPTQGCRGYDYAVALSPVNKRCKIACDRCREMKIKVTPPVALFLIWSARLRKIKRSVVVARRTR